ncbi:MAG TPA: hypothetical protein VHG69_02370 [Thermoleophilaceae bacterium]|nr:hypothetical protein [Thermoleophilaceae bacterium]
MHKHTILRERPIQDRPILDKRRIPTSPAPAEAQPDERGARRTLTAQVKRLEEELAGLITSAWPRTDAVAAPPASRGRGARLLALGELEALRDELTERVRAAKRVVAERAAAEERSRRLIEEMQLDPAAHRWVRVTNVDVGEGGCKNWHVRPRAGLLGMLMGWWRVIVSSGCP